MVSEAERQYSENVWEGMVLDLAPNALVEWHLGSSQESCRSCVEMAEMGPMAASEFMERGIYPQSRELDCHGFRCQCFLTVVDLPTVNDIQDLLDDLNRFGNIGDEGLAAFYDKVHDQIVGSDADWGGLTPVDAGKSWFDAPASSAGSFHGLRYGGNPTAEHLERMASPPNPADTAVNQAMNSRISFEVPVASATRYAGARYGSNERSTLGALRWSDEPERPPSTLTAPASSRGSFTGDRYGG